MKPQILDAQVDGQHSVQNPSPTEVSTMLCEPRDEKTCLRRLRSCKTRIGLLSYRDKLES